MGVWHFLAAKMVASLLMICGELIDVVKSHCTPRACLVLSFVSLCLAILRAP